MHGGFGQFARKSGLYSANDYDMFTAFDIEYDYDIREVFDRYLKGGANLSNYIDMLNFQECAYPDNYIKMRCLENHDQPRICSYIRDERALENFTAFLYFLKGTTLLYAGQEYQEDHVPSLFDKDVFRRNEGKDTSPLFAKLYKFKKDLLSAEDYLKGSADDTNHIAILERDDNISRKIGIFSLKGIAADVQVDLPDGSYINRLDGNTVEVCDGRIRCGGNPVVISVKSE